MKDKYIIAKHFYITLKLSDIRESIVYKLGKIPNITSLSVIDYKFRAYARTFIIFPDLNYESWCFQFIGNMNCIQISVYNKIREFCMNPSSNISNCKSIKIFV